MSNTPDVGAPADAEYARALAGEAEHWDSFVAQRLLRGEMPGSIDWRLTFTQFRYNHGWRPLCLGPQGINFRMREINYLLTAAAPRPGMRVLDLGCGAGWLSLELARRGAHVTGVDISPSNLALARYMAETNARNFPYLYQGFAGLPCRLEDFGSVEYLQADLNAVELPKGEFDAVVVWDSLHHVSELERLLEQVRAALKPEGILVGVDHVPVTLRTHIFNEGVLPQVGELYDWITHTDPEWLYEAVNSLAPQHDWGVLAVDYDPTPVPGFDSFSSRLFAEMLEIVRTGLRQEALEKARTGASDRQQPEDTVEESPFEDVSVEFLLQALTEQFHAERMHTICPFVEADKYIPHYRHEKERIFQHYLASTLIVAGERAIARGQADGQWFLFHLTRERPTEAEQRPTLRATGTGSHLDVFFRELEADPRRKTDYIIHLQDELERKNAALADLEERLRMREAELVALRRPRLPWKRTRDT
jgi:SAM-dependent methyltransferase